MSPVALVAALPVGALIAAAALPASASPAPSPRLGVFDPQPGSPDSGDSLFPHEGNGGYDVQHYGISLSWRTDGTIRATTTISATAKQDLSSFTLDFHGLTVGPGDVTIDGESSTFARAGDELTITPATSLHNGSTFTVVVPYHGTPQKVTDPDGSPDGWIPTDDGVTVVSEPIGAKTWFPCNNTPADKAAYSVTVTAPKGKTVASNGRLIGTSAVGDHRKTWQWRERDAMATYLASMSIGNYRQVVGTSRGGVRLHSFIDPSRGGVDTAKQVGTVVDYWSQKFGPYPFSTSGIIVDNVPVGYSLEVQTRPVFPFDPGYSTLLAHELAHQWFGDSVSLSDWSDIWLNEGFATYAEWLWQARTHPGAPKNRFDTLYAQGNGSFWNGIVAQPANGGQLFNGTIVYTRGAMALEALRLTIGTHDFFALVHRWTRQHAHGSATTAQFEAMAENVSGQDLGTLFGDWLHSSGKPPAI